MMQIYFLPSIAFKKVWAILLYNPGLRPRDFCFREHTPGNGLWPWDTQIPPWRNSVMKIRKASSWPLPSAAKAQTVGCLLVVCFYHTTSSCFSKPSCVKWLRKMTWFQAGSPGEVCEFLGKIIPVAIGHPSKRHLVHLLLSGMLGLCLVYRLLILTFRKEDGLLT